MNFNYNVLKNPRWWLMLLPLVSMFTLLLISYLLGVLLRCMGNMLCLGFEGKTPKWFHSLAEWVKRGEK